MGSPKEKAPVPSTPQYKQTGPKYTGPNYAQYHLGKKGSVLK